MARLAPIFYKFAGDGPLTLAPNKEQRVQVDSKKEAVFFFWVRTNDWYDGKHQFFILQSEHSAGGKTTISKVIILQYEVINQGERFGRFCLEIERPPTSMYASYACRYLDGDVRGNSIGWTFFLFAIAEKKTSYLYVKNFDNKYVSVNYYIRPFPINFETLTNWVIRLEESPRVQPNPPLVIFSNGFVLNVYDLNLENRFLYLYLPTDEIFFDINFLSNANSKPVAKGKLLDRLPIENFTFLTKNGLVLNSTSTPVTLTDVYLFKETKTKNVNFLLDLNITVFGKKKIELIRFGARDIPGSLLITLVPHDWADANDSRFRLLIEPFGHKYKTVQVVVGAPMVQNKTYTYYVGLTSLEYGITFYNLNIDNPMGDSDVIEYVNITLPSVISNLTVFSPEFLSANDTIIMRKFAFLDNQNIFFGHKVKSLGMRPTSDDKDVGATFDRCLIFSDLTKPLECRVCGFNFAFYNGTCLAYCGRQQIQVNGECVDCNGPCPRKVLTFRFEPVGATSFLAKLTTNVRFDTPGNQTMNSLCAYQVMASENLYRSQMIADVNNQVCGLTISPLRQLRNVTVVFSLPDTFNFYDDTQNLYDTKNATYIFEDLSPGDFEGKSLASGLGYLSGCLFLLGAFLALAFFCVTGTSYFYWRYFHTVLFGKMLAIAPMILLPVQLKSFYYAQSVIQVAIFHFNIFTDVDPNYKREYPMVANWPFSPSLIRNSLFSIVLLAAVSAACVAARHWQKKFGTKTRIIEFFASSKTVVCFWTFFFPEIFFFSLLNLIHCNFGSVNMICGFIISLFYLVLCLAFLLYVCRTHLQPLTKKISSHFFKTRGFFYVCQNLKFPHQCHSPFFIVTISLTLFFLALMPHNKLAVSIVAFSLVAVWFVTMEVFCYAWKSSFYWICELVLNVLYLATTFLLIMRSVFWAGETETPATVLTDLLFQIFYIVVMFTTSTVFVAHLVLKLAFFDWYSKSFERTWNMYKVIIDLTEKDVFEHLSPSKDLYTRLFMSTLDIKENNLPVIFNGQADQISDEESQGGLNDDIQNFEGFTDFTSGLPRYMTNNYLNNDNDGTLRHYRIHRRRARKDIIESIPINTHFLSQPQQGSILISPRNYSIQPFNLTAKRSHSHEPSRGSNVFGHEVGHKKHGDDFISRLNDSMKNMDLSVKSEKPPRTHSF